MLELILAVGSITLHVNVLLLSGLVDSPPVSIFSIEALTSEPT